MNAVMENILSRRSVRGFEEKEIPEEVLNDILLAAQYAPSAMNRQTWQFTAITDRQKIARLAEAMREALGKDSYDLYKPQVLVIVTNEQAHPLGIDDNACALENIFLAANSYGVGSCWINQLRNVDDDPTVRAILTEYGVPTDHSATGCAALGYPAPNSTREPNKVGKIVVVK